MLAIGIRLGILHLSGNLVVVVVVVMVAVVVVVVAVVVVVVVAAFIKRQIDENIFQEANTQEGIVQFSKNSPCP